MGKPMPPGALTGQPKAILQDCPLAAPAAVKLKADPLGWANGDEHHQQLINQLISLLGVIFGPWPTEPCA